MDRAAYYERMSAPEKLDYELYLSTGKLLACQKPFSELVNADELQFQIVHQVEELWMKLIAYTLLDIDDYIQAGTVHRTVTGFKRCAMLLRMMIAQLDLLETMSPKEYQEIRLRLGNGSGQESPGFRVLLRMAPELWQSFDQRYLTGSNRSIRDIYDTAYAHDDAYVVAECLIEFDEWFQKFRFNHIFLVQRSIGMGAASLKGRSVDLLQTGASHRFYPQLWDVRAAMTDAWGSSYGHVRDSLGSGSH